MAWLVRQGEQGHFPADWLIALVEPVDELLPAGALVIVHWSWSSVTAIGTGCDTMLGTSRWTVTLARAPS